MTTTEADMLHRPVLSFDSRALWRFTALVFTNESILSTGSQWCSISYEDYLYENMSVPILLLQTGPYILGDTTVLYIYMFPLCIDKKNVHSDNG